MKVSLILMIEVSKDAESKMFKRLFNNFGELDHLEDTRGRLRKLEDASESFLVCSVGYQKMQNQKCRKSVQ